jgi:hypothetical protein
MQFRRNGPSNIVGKRLNHGTTMLRLLVHLLRLHHHHRSEKLSNNREVTVMKKLLIATALLCTLASPAVCDDGLVATITQVKPADDNNYSILVVVDNHANKTFKWTEWSCIFYDNNNQIVGEDNVYVDISEPGKQSAKRTYVQSFKPFDTSECRLKGVRQ